MWVVQDKELAQYVLLIVNEMNICEDLVYDKFSGDLIGFVNLGDINQCLLAFEQSLNEELSTSTCTTLANSMVVFMARSLFTKLRFAFAQFPCYDLNGDFLYDPFWEAVLRMERCRLKVSLLTLCSVY